MDKSSPDAEKMHADMLDDVWIRLVANLAHDRGRTVEEIRAMFENGPYTAGDAVDAKLVDAVVEPNDLDRLIAAETGGLIRLEDKPEPERSDSWARPQIAVVYLEGDIVDGKSMEVPIIGERVAGGETIAASIAWARENPRVEGIILRVNSPGGSALASDLIAREMFQTRGKKPIVVSIGDVAASGGYFAAAPGDIVFAEPSSVTGSIGIFTGKFDLSALLGRVGITWETMRRGTHADMESYLRPYSDEERARIKEKLRYFYGRFVGAVARGRGMAEDEVDQIGRGHVWTGAQAKDRKLIDKYGGLLDAVAEVKRRAGRREDDMTEVVMLPAEPPSLVARLLGMGGSEDSLSAGVPGVVPGIARELLRLVPASLLVDPTAVQARLPFVFVE
jgi:protease-4